MKNLIGKLALLYIFALIFAFWGFKVSSSKWFPYNQVMPVYLQIKGYVERQFAGLHLQQRENRFGFIGFKKIDKDFKDPGFVLISRFSEAEDQPVVELFRLKDFKLIHQWVPPVDEILSRSDKSLPGVIQTKDAFRAFHPLLLYNGDLVFHSDQGALTRINKNNEIIWLIDKHFHHSLELSNDNKIYAGFTFHPNEQKFPEGIREDGYAVVSLDGKIIETCSAAKILMGNGLTSLFLGVGQIETDRLHLNDAQPINRDSGLAKVGDVALSIRQLSTVLLYRPDSHTVIWAKTGPWLNQHDINLMQDGRYSIFGNDMYRPNFDNNYRKLPVADYSQIYVYDAESDTVSTPFDSILRSEQMRSLTEGRSTLLENGDVFIEETERCRLLRVSEKEVRWLYVSGESKEKSNVITWCRYLTADDIRNKWKEIL